MDFFTTTISEKSIELANKVLSSGFISAGKMAEEFESSLSHKLGMPSCVSVNSGTSALHLALVVAGVSRGDEVILPAQTFIATAYTIMMQGATPVFADIELDTGNIDVNSIRLKITEKTKAIMPVHWAGYPCDMDAINAIAKEFNLAVIEDAAHALGAKYNGRPVGSLSRFTAFSFQAIKHITSGDGGAVAALNSDDVYLLKRLRWFDIDRDNSKPDILGERVYDAKHVGYKYHMNDLAAAVALGNLYEFERMQQRIKIIASEYTNNLNNISGIKLPVYSAKHESAYWLYTLFVENRENFIRALKDRGVPTSVVHRRIDKNSVFGGLREDLHNQAIYDDVQICIPIHSNLTDDEVSKIIQSIQKGW